MNSGLPVVGVTEEEGPLHQLPRLDAHVDVLWRQVGGEEVLLLRFVVVQDLVQGLFLDTWLGTHSPR